MGIAALIVAILGVLATLLLTLFVVREARKLNEQTLTILSVIFNGLMELGLTDEAINWLIKPLIQKGCISIMTKAGGHRDLLVSKKRMGILGRVGNTRKMPRTPIEIKWI